MLAAYPSPSPSLAATPSLSNARSKRYAAAPAPCSQAYHTSYHYGSPTISTWPRSTPSITQCPHAAPLIPLKNWYRDASTDRSPSRLAAAIWSTNFQVNDRTSHSLCIPKSATYLRPNSASAWARTHSHEATFSLPPVVILGPKSPSHICRRLIYLSTGSPTLPSTPCFLSPNLRWHRPPSPPHLRSYPRPPNFLFFPLLLYYPYCRKIHC